MVLLASVLKPVDDTRMRGKFAETLRERPGTRVHIAGRRAGPTASLPAPEVFQHPIFDGTRLSLGRLGAQWRYWRLLRQLRPALVVVHAPELLPLTLLWQRLGRGRRFVYDIRENYALNVTTQGLYRGRTRRWLAAGLRWVEGHAARRAAGLILAEASYAGELPFLHRLPASRVVVLENKYQPAPTEILPRAARPAPGPTEPLRLLYSGTISALNGVWQAEAVAALLHPRWPGGVVLTVIGFCQSPELLRRLRLLAAQAPWLRLISGAEPVPHSAIAAEIRHAHFGLLPYLPHPSTERCRPTKLFEYLANGLPVLVPKNPLWQELVERYDAGLVADVQQPAVMADLLFAALEQPAARGSGFYPSGVPTDVLWAAEGKKLWLLLDSVI